MIKNLFIFIILFSVYSKFRPIPKKFLKSDKYYIDQKYNHFDPFETRTFKQKYYVNDEYWQKPDGPVLLSMGGEGPCNGIDAELGKIAEELHAKTIIVEHRYYGESCPFDSQNLKNEDLKFLSSKQYLEDVAYFRNYYQTQVIGDHGNKWIALGGSYSGALSGWVRYKYPHYFDGAWSSSGVVNTIYNFPEFDEQVCISADFTTKGCCKAVRDATLITQNLVDNATTRDETLRKFEEAAVKMVDGDFYYMIADLTVFPIQYAHPHDMCDVMMKGGDLFNNFLEFYHKSSVRPSEYSRETFKRLDNNAGRMWWFQKCTDTGYFQVAPEKNSIRSKHLNLDYHNQLCKEVFGVENPEELIQDSVDYYGGIDILKKTTNIFFGNGSLDPWQRATVIGPNGVNDTDIVFMVHCKNCGHCCDISGCPGGCVPPDEYEKAQQLAIAALKSWVK